MAAQNTSYHGNCHCGRYRFELNVPEIKEAIACTCSLCTKKGYLWLIPPPDAFKVIRDDGQLTEYRSSTVQDKFCNYCGTGVVCEHSVGPLRGQFAVNVRAIQEINPFQLESAINTVATDDNEKVWSISTPSEPRPSHVGSCHCQKVQVELMVPLSELEIKEDNCSSCVRTAYIGVYPTKDQVKIHGREHTFEYRYGSKFSGSTYCSTCGVHVFTDVYGPPLSIFDKVPPERREHVMSVYRQNMNMQPLNVRAFNGVDLGSLQIKRTDEGTEGYKLDS